MSTFIFYAFYVMEITSNFAATPFSSTAINDFN